MLPERSSPDDPREWLRRARSNLDRTKVRLPTTYLEDLCFDAQQSAEKAIKAVLLYRNVTFPYVHDLGLLLTLLDIAGEAIPSDIREAKELTTFAVVTRYPGLAEPVTEMQYQRAIQTAERVLHWAEEQISKGDVVPKPNHTNL